MSSTLALTRAASPAGTALARALGSAGDHVVGLDRESGAAGGIDWRTGDLAAPTVVGGLRDVDVLVHLAADTDLDRALSAAPATRRARVLAETRTLATAAAAAGVGHLVLVTSAMVHGARADNPVPLAEDSPRRSADTEGLVADLLAVEAEVEQLRPALPALRITVLRPAALVGPGVDTTITRHFEAPRLLTLRGTVPAWQFCHLDDLAGAVRTVATGRLPGELAVGAPGALTQREVEQLTGMRHVELSQTAAHAAVERLHRLGMIPVPASDLAYVAHPWVVEPQALLEAGWRPLHDNGDCLATLVEGVRGHHAFVARRLRSRDAALGAAAGAASATVAVAATAALRRRRRRD